MSQTWSEQSVVAMHRPWWICDVSERLPGVFQVHPTYDPSHHEHKGDSCQSEAKRWFKLSKSLMQNIISCSHTGKSPSTHTHITELCDRLCVGKEVTVSHGSCWMKNIWSPSLCPHLDQCGLTNYGKKSNHFCPKQWNVNSVSISTCMCYR